MAELRHCPLRADDTAIGMRECAQEACQWWVSDAGDKEQGGDCAMIYLALRKEPKWKYGGPTAGSG